MQDITPRLADSGNTHSNKHHNSENGLQVIYSHAADQQEPDACVHALPVAAQIDFSGDLG